MRTIQEQLREKGLSDALRQEEASANTQASKRPKETLSRKEWEEIIGMNRETFQRVSGTVRRKR